MRTAAVAAAAVRGGRGLAIVRALVVAGGDTGAEPGAAGGETRWMALPLPLP